MEREVLLNAAYIGNLLQITVEFLIGDDGQELTVEILPFVLFKYPSNPQLSSSASFLRLNVLSSLN